MIWEKNICLRKYEDSVERISICNAIENLAEHSIHCLPCSYINDAIDIMEVLKSKLRHRDAILSMY